MLKRHRTPLLHSVEVMPHASRLVGCCPRAKPLASSCFSKLPIGRSCDSGVAGDTSNSQPRWYCTLDAVACSPCHRRHSLPGWSFGLSTVKCRTNENHELHSRYLLQSTVHCLAYLAYLPYCTSCRRLYSKLAEARTQSTTRIKESR